VVGWPAPLLLVISVCGCFQWYLSVGRSFTWVSTMQWKKGPVVLMKNDGDYVVVNPDHICVIAPYVTADGKTEVAISFVNNVTLFFQGPFNDVLVALSSH